MTPTTFAKGEVIQSLCPWKLFPLFLDDGDTRWEVSLPKYEKHALSSLQSIASLNAPSSEINLEQRINRLFRDMSVSDYYVALTLHLSVQGKEKILCTSETVSSFFGPKNSQRKWPENDAFTEAWTWVQDYVTWEEWKMLYTYVATNSLILAVPHPLLHYSHTIVPQLNQEELGAVATILGLKTKLCCNDSRSLVLRLMHTIEESFGPRQYIALFNPQSPLTRPNHSILKESCLPNAALEIISPTKIDLIALYDDVQPSLEEPIRLSKVPPEIMVNQDGDQRACTNPTNKSNCSLLSCDSDCPRCHYMSSPLQTRPWKLSVQLGHHFFLQGKYATARNLYLAALRQNSNLDDVRHALGALELSQGKFLMAQKTWSMASDKMKSQGRPITAHPGIALQIEKQEAYHYLQGSKYVGDITSQAVSGRDYHFQSYFDNQCFVTPMLEQHTCSQIIAWATTQVHTSEWTTNRHYAVPTYDIPVHKVPALLEWFHPWMTYEANPLLQEQFQVSKDYHFYVHDAFCVRYQPNKASFLPLHCDESTHSMVICLNDSFEGGGTYFSDYDTILRPKAGNVVSFKGGTLRHGGDAVLRGVRFILAVFLYLDHKKPPSEEVTLESGNKKANKVQSMFGRNKKQKTDFSFGFSIPKS